MTVEYALERTEIVQNFFRSLGSSPKYLLTLLCYAFGFGIFELAITGAFSKPFTISDVYTFLIAAASLMVFLPILLFLLGKTSKRSLTISPDGIATEIASHKGQVPWKQVRTIFHHADFVLIARTNGNAFLIPKRAFSDSGQQREFAALATQWVSRAH